MDSNVNVNVGGVHVHDDIMSEVLIPGMDLYPLLGVCVTWWTCRVEGLYTKSVTGLNFG